MTNGAIMKPNVTKFSLVALAVWALAACSTGSSGYQPPVPVNPNQTPNNAVNTMTVPVENTGSGAAIVLSGADEQAIGKRLKLTDQTDIQNVTVDGITFAISQLNSDSWHSDTSKYSDVVAAIVISSENQDGKDMLFYTGKPTLQMPVSGTAVYEGQAAITGEDILSDNDVVTGTSHFNADFANKTLNGRLNFEEGVGQINIAATINNNQFSGTASAANNEQIKTSGSVEGKFYGEEAKSLGGLAKGSDNSWGAVFAAGKQ